MKKSVGSPEQEVLKRVLKQLRADAGLTQAQLAERLNTLQTIVSNFEIGERRLDVLELRQVCRALGVDLHLFVNRLENELEKDELERDELAKDEQEKDKLDKGERKRAQMPK